MDTLNEIIKYTELVGIFFWELQAATIGQVAGNLTICQNSSVTVYNNSMGVYSKYENMEFDEAGNSTYAILYSIDNIYTACYYMLFEYMVALQ